MLVVSEVTQLIVVAVSKATRRFDCSSPIAEIARSTHCEGFI